MYFALCGGTKWGDIGGPAGPPTPFKDHDLRWS
jgi:hypothetical protein